MEKENFYQILEEFCSYNSENYFNEATWYNESLASQIDIDSQRHHHHQYSHEYRIQKEKDDYHKRKQKLFDKMVNSYEKNSTNSNSLLMTPSHPGEKYAYQPTFNWKKYDFLSADAPLEEFLSKLKEAVIGDFFYEPINNEFNVNAEVFIESFLLNSNESLSKLTIALEGYGRLCVYQGRMIHLAKLISSYETNDTFNKALIEASKGINETLMKVLELLNDNNFELYPIMRNYSIVDIFNVNKNILFTNRNTDTKPYTSIATDSKYIYAILYGVCGGIFKIGSGKDGTIKGRIYKFNSSLNTNETNPMLVYVKVTNKLYLKTNQMEFGQIRTINVDTLTIECTKLLNLPEKLKDRNLYDQNLNYILLADESHLYAIALQPDTINPSTTKTIDDLLIVPPPSTLHNTYGSMDPYYRNQILGSVNKQSIVKKTFESVSLVLFKFSMNSNKNVIKEEKDQMINELYESFSCIFRKDKCKKALEKKSYDMEKAANFLIKKHNDIPIEKKEESEIKLYEEIFFSECVTLYQAKVEMIPSMTDHYMELAMVGTAAVPFDPTKFGLLKWVIAKENLYAYKLQQGACVVFSTKKENEKEFNVDISNNYFTNEDIGYGKRFNPKKMDGEGMFRFKDSTGFKHGIANPNVNLPADEMSYHQLFMENLIVRKRDDNPHGIDASTLEKKKSFLKDIKNVLPKNIAASYSQFAKQNIPGSTNPNPLSTTSITINSNPPIITTTTSTTTTTTTTSANKNPPSISNIFANLNIISNQEMNYKPTNNQSSTNKSPVNNSNNSIESSPFNTSGIEEENNLFLNQSLIEQYFNAHPHINPNTNLPYSKSEIEYLLSNQEKVLQAKRSLNTKPSTTIPLMSTVSQITPLIYKGTLLRVLRCLSSNTIGNIAETFCYDSNNSCFYILSISLLSISILVSDTFESQHASMKTMIHDASCDHMDIIPTLKEIYSNKDAYMNNNNESDKKIITVDYIMNVLMHLNNFCYDLPWRYSNWNFYYSNLNLVLSYNEDRIKPSLNEYPYKLLSKEYPNNHTGGPNLTTVNLNDFDKKINSESKETQIYILNQIEKEFKIKLGNYNETKESKKKSLTYNLNTKGNTVFTWDNKNEIHYEITNDHSNDLSILSSLSSPLNKKAFAPYIYNNRIFFNSINGIEEELDIILTLIKAKPKTLSRLFIFIYFWANNLHYNSLIDTSKHFKESIEQIRKLIIDNLYQLSINDILYKIIIEHFEVIFTTLESQFVLFITLYSLQSNGIYILYKLMDKFALNRYCNNLLLNTFHKANCMKIYSIKYNKSKMSQLVITSTMIQLNKNMFAFPFHLILFNSLSQCEGVKYPVYLYDNNSNSNSLGSSCVYNKFNKVREELMIMTTIQNQREYSDFFWDVMVKEIANKKSKTFLNFFSSLLIRAVGFKSTKEAFNGIFNKAYALMVKLLNQTTINCNGSDSNEMEVLNLAHIIMFAYQSKSSMSSIENLNSFMQKNSFLFNKILQMTSQAFPQLNRIELLGRETENEKFYEYNLRDDLMISQTAFFANENIIIVEIEVIHDSKKGNISTTINNNKAKNSNYYLSNTDLIIKSNQHSPSKSFNGNNHHDFGTCFMYKISHHSDKKRFYLLGNEVTITSLSPSSSDYKYMPSHSNPNDHNRFSPSSLATASLGAGGIKANAQSNSSSRLHIKFFPFNEIRYGRGLYSIDQPLLQKLLQLTNDADYFNTFILRKMINCTMNSIYINDHNHDYVFPKEYDQIIQSDQIEKSEQENIIKRSLEFNVSHLEEYGEYCDTETNYFSYCLRYIEMRTMKMIPEVKKLIIDKKIGKDIEKLQLFNVNLWNCLANMCYYCYIYHHINSNSNNNSNTIDQQELTSFITAILNHCALRIKLEKSTFDNIRIFSEDTYDTIAKSEKKNKNEINDLIKEIKTKITSEIKAQYFSNEATLNEACEINMLLLPNEVDEGISLDDKLSILTNFIIEQVVKYTSFTDIKKHNQLTKGEIMTSIKISSPYITVPITMINRLLFLMKINRIELPSQIDLMKRFVMDQKISLGQCLKILYIKSHINVLKNYGLQCYKNYLKEIENIELGSYWNLFANSIGTCHGKHCLMLKIYNNKNNNSTSVIEDIDYIMTIISNQLPKQMNACITKDNHIFHTNRIIQYIAEINNLFNYIPLNSQKKIEGIILEALGQLFNHKLYISKAGQELFDSFHKLTNTITQSNNKFSLDILKLFSDIISKQANDLIALKNILCFLEEIAFPQIDNMNQTVEALINIIFDMITTIKQSDTLSYLCKIAKKVLGNAKGFKPTFDKLYKKIGQMINVDYRTNNTITTIEENTIEEGEEMYKVIINANSNELDYNFLVNVLYHFEMRYPTYLSMYYNKEMFDKHFPLDSLLTIPINFDEISLTKFFHEPCNHPTITPDINSANPIKDKDKLAIAGILNKTASTIAIANNQKTNPNIPLQTKPQSIRDILPVYSLSTLNSGAHSKNSQVGAANRLKSKEPKTQKMLNKCEEITKQLKEKIINESTNGNNKEIQRQFIINLLHINRIIRHIKIAEACGFAACTKGFSILNGVMKREQAITFARLVYEGLNDQLDSPYSSINPHINDGPLFNTTMLFPPLPKIDELVEGYTNIIKETTLNYANVTIVKENIYNTVLDTNLRTIHQQSILSKEDFLSGESTLTIIHDLISLIYDIAEDNQIITEKISNDFNTLITINPSQYDINIFLGLVILIAGEHHKIRVGQIAKYNNKEVIVINNNCELRSQCEIIDINAKNDKRIKILKDELTIIKRNVKLLKAVDTVALIKMLLKKNESLKMKEKTIEERLLIHYLLKILSQLEFENSFSNKCKEDSDNLIELLYEIIDINTINTNHNSLLNKENEFTSTLMRLFDKNDKHFSTNIFIPKFNISLIQLSSSSPTAIIQIPPIKNYVLPEPTYLSQLPQISLSKCFACLSNAIKFDKSLVEAIINAYKNDKFPNAVAMSTSQIRSHLLKGNIKAAYNDLGIVFGGAPITRNIFSEEVDVNELPREKCYVGKVLLCSDAKLHSPTAVVVLLNDFIGKAVLVMSFENCIEMFWTNYETLGKLTWEYPANAYEKSKVRNEMIDSINELDAVYGGMIVMRMEKEKERKRLGQKEVLRYAMLLNANGSFNEDQLGENNNNSHNNIKNQEDIDTGLTSSSSDNEGDNTEVKIETETNITTTLSTIGKVFVRHNSKCINVQSLLSKDLQSIPLHEWTLSKWKSLSKETITFQLDLFSIAKEKYGSLIPLHELLSFKSTKTSKDDDYPSSCSSIIISFDQSAYLGPQASLRFYSDQEGVNFLTELIAIKKERNDLQSIIIPSSKVYMEYIPGTTIFYNSEWFLHSRDSYLPCSISFIPSHWNTLLNITDIYVNRKEINIKLLIDFIKAILPNCFIDSFPIEFQMKIMKMMNRILSKNKKSIINLISKEPGDQNNKLQVIGLTKKEYSLLISTFNQKCSLDKLFASPYIIELSECILHIYTSLNESKGDFTSLISIDHHNLIKLYELMRYILKEGELNEMLEKEILKDMIDDNNDDDVLNNKIVIINGPKTIDECIKVIINNGGNIYDKKKDVIALDNKNNYGILIHDYNDEKLMNKGRSDKDNNKDNHKEEEESLWECAGCNMQNDKENTVCVFCDTQKTVVIKNPILIKKKVNEELYKNDKRVIDNKYLHEQFTLRLQDKTANPDIIITILPINDVLINTFLSKRYKQYTKEDIDIKLCLVDKYINNKKSKEIIKELIKQPMTMKSIKELYDNGIDIYYDIAILPYNQYQLDMIQLEKSKEFMENQLLLNPTITIKQIRTGYDSTMICLAQHRYNCCIITKLNQYLKCSLSLINPPETKDDKSHSSFLSKVRSLIYTSIKLDLINDIISLSEYTEDLIQIPTFKIDRISNMAHVNESSLSGIGGAGLSSASSQLLSQSTFASIINNADLTGISSQRKALLRSIKRKGEHLYEHMMTLKSMLGNNLQKQLSPMQLLMSMSLSSSSFIQVYEQAQLVDPACYRSRKVDRDHNAFKIEFQNELVQGLSGPYRQFFSDITNELMMESKAPFDKGLLLIPTQNNQNKKGEFKDKFTINPSCDEYSQFEFLGILMGICIRTGVYLPIDFCSFIWKKIVLQNIDLNDIKQFDEGLYQMHQLLSNTNGNVIPEEIRELNSITLSDCTEAKLSGNNLNTVNTTTINEDPKQLLKSILRIRFNECEKQIKCIRKGIAKILPISLIKFLTWREFEKLVCGNKTIDIPLLKANTIISAELKSDKHYLVDWLWEILDEFNDAERVSFIKFCYAQERLPPNQEEYTKRQVVFTIKMNIASKKDLLPRADTCFFFLILPDYTTKEIMKKMMTIAMNIDNVGMNGDKVNDNLGGNNINDQDAYGMFRGVNRRGRGGGRGLYDYNDDYYEDY